MVSREIARRDERRISMASKSAQFPFVRELEGFDWSAQPSLDPRQIRELATYRSIAHGYTTLLMGPTFGDQAEEKRSDRTSVPFVTAATLVATLAKVHDARVSHHKSAIRH
jgi:hypothetical protein